jgi:hypothetical protein
VARQVARLAANRFGSFAIFTAIRRDGALKQHSGCPVFPRKDRNKVATNSLKLP